MTMMYRRHFLCAAATVSFAALALSVPVDVPLAQQVSGRPQVKLSQAKPKVIELVDTLARNAKEHGVEISQDKKNEMVDDILAKMEAQGTYAFVDP